ncbi:MAG: transglycosylase domain-containing protein [Clostridia bacterium]|nr:transglycosylase domain-containing protein [Clostridia bacterium]
MFKFIKRLIFSITIALLIASGIVGYQGYDMYKTAIAETSIAEKVQEIKEEVSEFTTYDQLPKDYINAVIAVEDRRFFDHNGIDIISIGRAVVTNVKEKRLAEGGSTITQQLAKNTYFTQKKEFTRKIAEIFMAREFENSLSKEEIFELYVNTMYFGDGYYCIADAAEGYFDKEVSQMNLHEATLLAGIPNAPSVYSPNANPELSRQRHSQVIRQMVKYNYLEESKGEELLKEIEK